MGRRRAFERRRAEVRRARQSRYRHRTFRNAIHPSSGWRGLSFLLTPVRGARAPLLERTHPGPRRTAKERRARGRTLTLTSPEGPRPETSPAGIAEITSQAPWGGPPPHSQYKNTDTGRPGRGRAERAIGALPSHTETSGGGGGGESPRPRRMNSKLNSRKRNDCGFRPLADTNLRPARIL